MGLALRKSIALADRLMLLAHTCPQGLMRLTLLALTGLPSLEAIDLTNALLRCAIEGLQSRQLLQLESFQRRPSLLLRTLAGRKGIRSAPPALLSVSCSMQHSAKSKGSKSCPAWPASAERC
jgi:hypothetical protein